MLNLIISLIDNHLYRWHLFRPRPVIPGQRIHSSILSVDAYKPRANLRGGIDIPTTRTSDELWATEPLNEEATTRLLSSLLDDHKTAIEFLEKVLFLLDSGTFRLCRHIIIIIKI